MPFGYESAKNEQYHHEYTEGGQAQIKGKPRIAPMEDQASEAAKAWYEGYDEMADPHRKHYDPNQLKSPPDGKA